jgi:hypothetical protein
MSGRDITKLTQKEWDTKVEAIHVFPWMGDSKMPLMEASTPTARVLRRMCNPCPDHIFTDKFADILRGEFEAAHKAWQSDRQYYLNPGFTLKDALRDDVLLQEGKSLLWVPVVLTNRYVSKGRKHPTRGGVVGWDRRGIVRLGVNPGQSIARCSWAVIHEMWHLADMQRGKFIGSGRVLVEQGYTAYEKLPTERRAQAYACSHMFRLGWSYGHKMTCKQLWESI